MTSVLDHYAPTAFRPTTTREVFALRLAQRLGESAAVRHFVNLTEEHSEEEMLAAYRRVQHGKLQDPGRRFHDELRKTRFNTRHDPVSSLAAVRIERRTVAIAIFNGDHLEYADSRQLSSDKDKALASATEFIAWMLDRFEIQSAALESVAEKAEIQRGLLHQAACAVLRDRMVPIWEVPRHVMLEGYGRPQLGSRSELRHVALTIWPILSGPRAKIFIQDAAVLGLYVQIERLFILN